MAVSAGEQSAVVDFMWLQEVVLTIPPGADPVLKSTDWPGVPADSVTGTCH